MSLPALCLVLGLNSYGDNFITGLWPGSTQLQHRRALAHVMCACSGAWQGHAPASMTDASGGFFHIFCWLHAHADGFSNPA